MYIKLFSLTTQSTSCNITKCKSSSSLCHPTNTALPDPLSPPIPIVYRSRDVFQATSCLSMWRGEQEYVTYEFFLTSPAMSQMSGSSNLDNFRDGWLVAVQLLFYWVLPPGFVQCCSQHSCVIAVKLFLHTVSLRPLVHPYSSIDTTAAWKKLRFILPVSSDFHMTDRLSIAVHAFASHVLMSFSVDETLLPR